MAKIKPIELSTLIGNLALDSMNTQLLFNEAHEADIKRFEALATTVDPTVRQFLQPLVPSRSRVLQFFAAAVRTAATATSWSFQVISSVRLQW